MLRKLLLPMFSITIILCIGVSYTVAGQHAPKKQNFGIYQKRSHQDVLHMYVFDENRQWMLTKNAPKGKLKYNMWGDMFNFTFKGIKLAPDTDYALVYYKEGFDSILLGEGLADERGRIYFENTIDTCSMPSEDDTLYDFGARILLVPSVYVFEGNVSLPQESDMFLEGSHLIRFFDTNGCVDPDDNDEWVDDTPSVDDTPPTEDYNSDGGDGSSDDGQDDDIIPNYFY